MLGLLADLLTLGIAIAISPLAIVAVILMATSGKGRTNAQYVGDLYNAFLRRGGDLGGVQFWINEIATSARTRENVRQQFLASAEFQARVTNVVNQGCLP